MRYFYILVLLPALLLAGCDEDKSGGNDEKTGANSVVANCLANHAAFARTVPLTTEGAVGAFAAAAEDCKASKKEIVAFAKKLENSGLGLTQERE